MVFSSTQDDYMEFTLRSTKCMHNGIRVSNSVHVK